MSETNKELAMIERSPTPVPEICPRCGSALPTDAPARNCPACLLTLALTPLPEDFEESLAAPPDSNSSPEPQLVRYFGDYELRREIGRGGMGVVYEARQISLGRPVALKMILAGQVATPAAIRRFHIEAEAVARLDHPNIVSIYEMGQYDGQRYYAMKLINGGPLADRMSSRRDGDGWAPRTVVELMEKIARAVHYAHQCGVLHRDLKPTNILLDSQEQPHVTDFGLAKVLEGEEFSAASSAMIGTPAYMAPEQAAGEQVTTAADIFSLGAIFYEMLTGHLPFSGPTMLETVRQAALQDPTPPRALNPVVDRDLETICLKCLNKQPTARYGSADALAQDLGRWLRGEPITARPAGATEKIVRWCRRKPALAALWAALFLLLIAGIVGITWQWRRANARAEEAREGAWRAHLASARAERHTTEAGARLRAFAAIREAAEIKPSLEARNEAIAALTLTDVRFARVWTNDQPAEFAKYSPDLERIAIQQPDGGIYIRRASDGAEVSVLPSVGGSPEAILFSPNGRWLAANYRNASNVLWHLTSSQPALRWEPGECAFCFAPDSQRLVVMHASGSLWMTDIEIGRELWRTNAGTFLRTLCFQPQGNWFVGLQREGRVFEVRDSRDGAVLQTIALPTGAGSLAWSPDGQRVLVGLGNGDVQVWDVDSGREITRWQAHDDNIVTFGFSPDGRWLASQSWDTSIRLWELPDFRLAVSARGYSMPYQAQFSADGRWLAFAAHGTTRGLLEIVPPTVLQRIHLPPSSARGAWSLDVSNDGKLLAVAHSESCDLVDIATHKAVASRHITARTVLFTPDGAGLLTSGEEGIHHWPINPGSDRALLGPPRIVREGLQFHYASMSADGRWIAAANWGASCVSVYELGNPTNRFSLGPHAGISYVAFSPNGRWIASGTWNGRNVRVWDVATRRLSQELITEGTADVFFSPDSQLLVVAGPSYQIFNTANWSERYRGPRAFGSVGAAAFSADSRVLAVVTDNGSIQLLEAHTGRVLADLEAPDRTPMSWLRFSPDGARLFALKWTRSVQVWDLQRTREELAALKLDW